MHSTEYIHIDPTKTKDLPRWKLELEARFNPPENTERFPDLLHVPFSVTAAAVITEDYRPHHEAIHFVAHGTKPLRTQRLMFYEQEWQPTEAEHL